MYQLTCIPTQITKNDSTFVVLKPISGKAPEKPFQSLKQVAQRGLPLNIPVQLLWEYATLDDGAHIVDIVAFQLIENWDFSDTTVEIIPAPFLEL